MKGIDSAGLGVQFLFVDSLITGWCPSWSPSWSQTASESFSGSLCSGMFDISVCCVPNSICVFYGHEWVADTVAHRHRTGKSNSTHNFLYLCRRASCNSLFLELSPALSFQNTGPQGGFILCCFLSFCLSVAQNRSCHSTLRVVN